MRAGNTNWLVQISSNMRNKHLSLFAELVSEGSLGGEREEMGIVR